MLMVSATAFLLLASAGTALAHHNDNHGGGNGAPGGNNPNNGGEDPGNAPQEGQGGGNSNGKSDQSANHDNWNSGNAQSGGQGSGNSIGDSESPSENHGDGDDGPAANTNGNGNGNGGSPADDNAGSASGNNNQPSNNNAGNGNANSSPGSSGAGNGNSGNNAPGDDNGDENNKPPADDPGDQNNDESSDDPGEASAGNGRSGGSDRSRVSERVRGGDGPVRGVSDHLVPIEDEASAPQEDAHAEAQPTAEDSPVSAVPPQAVRSGGGGGGLPLQEEIQSLIAKMSTGLPGTSFTFWVDGHVLHVLADPHPGDESGVLYKWIWGDGTITIGDAYATHIFPDGVEQTILILQRLDTNGTATHEAVEWIDLSFYRHGEDTARLPSIVYALGGDAEATKQQTTSDVAELIESVPAPPLLPVLGVVILLAARRQKA
jgi:hypothetical protein